MVIKQNSTGFYLTLSKGFRKGLTAKQRTATFHDPKVAGLASVIPSGFLKVCRTCRLDPAKVTLCDDPVF